MDTDPRSVLRHHWPDHDADVSPVSDGGLINRTWLVGLPPASVVQWVSPVFDPRIHIDIDAVTRRLNVLGVPTPTLIPTAAGELWIDDPHSSGCWRLQTYVPGRTLHQLPSPEAACSAGKLVGAFHAALTGWSYDFVAPRRMIHDTVARMSELQQALRQATGSPLEPGVRAVGERTLASWLELGPEPACEERCCHGDLKVSNLRFDPTADAAVALIDLDTVGPLPLATELGDAWRSWCNPAGEDQPELTHFSLELFASSLRGWASTGPQITAHEQTALVRGVERICLELAARFCADAVHASYFREDRRRFPTPGSHNLHRARCQLALAQSVGAQRRSAERIVTEILGDVRSPER